jgi:hypothetical protein
VLMLAQDDETPAAEGMKGVANGDFMSQNPGIMNCLPTPVGNEPLPSIVGWGRPS